MAEAAPPSDGNLVVVVRAPNQETQDFEVACPETWSVLRLKQHLQENYQGNPVSIYELSILLLHLSPKNTRSGFRVRIDRPATKCLCDFSIWPTKSQAINSSIPFLQIPVDQKLIYSGQLLEDEAVLREVLRHEGASPSRHTVHLVCRSPKGVPATRRASNVATPQSGNPGTSQANSNIPFSIHQSSTNNQSNGMLVNLEFGCI